MKLSTPDRKISEELQAIANELEQRLEQIAGQKMNFSLVIFQTELGSRMNYISNTKREDVVGAMQSLLTGWGKGMPDLPAHKFDS